MAKLTRYTRPVDGSIPVPALLYDDEHLHASQDDAGIYDGPKKSPLHQSGSVHVTSHRLIFITDTRTKVPYDGSSFALDLQYIADTNYYSGFFKSSPKITCTLSALNTGPSVTVTAASASTPSLGQSSSTGADSPKPKSTLRSSTLPQPNADPFETWECAICGHRNPPGLSPSARKVCALCGIPRDSVPSTASASPAPSTTPLSINNPISRSTSARLSSIYPDHLSKSASDSPRLSSSPPSERSSLQIDSKSPAQPPAKSNTIACPACTFLNHPFLRNCEICGTSLPPSSSASAGASNLQHVSKSAPTSRPSSPGNSDADADDAGDGTWYIKISFRKGGDKAFNVALKRALSAKVWEGKLIGKWGGTAVKAGTETPSDRVVRSGGINAILSNVQFNADNTATDMTSAFEDLEALMSKAKDMVRFAAELNDKLSAIAPAAGTTEASSTGPIVPEEATFIRSSLSQLGLQMRNAPVTLDMIKDEDKWVKELARELARVLQGDGVDANGKPRVGMMRERGIIGLDEVWGGWNRARGVALVPPSTFLQTMVHLPIYTKPTIRSRKLNSGLTVLHTPEYSVSSFTDRLLARIVEYGPQTTVQVAQEESLSVGLVQDIIGEVEMIGEICRDEAGVGVTVEVKWWVNIFVGYKWDGQVDS